LAIPRPIWLNPSHSLRDARETGADSCRRKGAEPGLSGRHPGFGTKSLWRQGLAGKLLGANSASRAVPSGGVATQTRLAGKFLAAAPGRSAGRK
jgi:hypothetical protein